MAISIRDLQIELRDKGFYNGPISNVEGPMTIAAINNFLQSRRTQVEQAVFRSNSLPRKRLAVIQLIFRDLNFYSDRIDGLMGQNTRYATELWQNRTRQEQLPARPEPEVRTRWPRRTQLESLYGKPGTGHTMLSLPFPMRIAWDPKQIINRVTVHSKCADSLDTILKDILRVYGYEELKKLRIDMFGGIYNNRPMRAGSVLSVHAYAAAIDLDPEKNQLRWGADQATFARPVYKPMRDAFRKERWTSLGEERNMDFMHFQASDL
jgi:peptidoglycan hydrolase-like protein with peptidoglycan-binding domain